ncbi:MAG TPA: dodecin family protein [Xanthomonadales bacterium]|nr:dodecin family protein [Xanthomonadales bacterium]
MAVAKVIEVIAGSKVGFEDAIKQGVERANDTVTGIQSAWVKEQQVVVERGRVVEYRVTLKLTFMLEAKKARKR